MTRVLLVDRSGRGHALADLFVRTDPEVEVLYAPGCPAADGPRIRSFPGLTMGDLDGLVKLAVDERVDFALVSSAPALGAGLVDRFRAAGVAAIGPDAAAARLETSKAYTKRLCAKHGVPVADFQIFDELEAARGYVRSVGYPVVVKADGLCAGNGTFVCDDAEGAVAAVDRLMVERPCGEAGDVVVVERRLYGRELSFFVLLDGRGGYAVLPMALDYPKSDDGNTGLTCGGMGALSPHPLEEPALLAKMEAQLLRPLLKAIAAEGLDYTGVLYLGSMLVGDQLHLLEINVRMGDPEAEAAFPRIESDFTALCRAIVDGTLGAARPLELNALHFCAVVAAQGRTRQRSGGRNKGWYAGWPYGRYGKHYPVTGVERVDPSKARVFLGEAAVLPDRGLVSDGARVLHVVGHGASAADAVENAYDQLRHIDFEGVRFRTDIGRVMPWDEAAEVGGAAAGAEG
ncbi:MAG TPA: phosphoribosylamine--glycine ligase [Longimicrobium sp.]|nr:phosphoribosylamine--glycine ligase [Longimicrobium sp.]